MVALVLLQFAAVTAYAVDGAGFSGVALAANAASQKISITGAMDAGTAGQVSVIVRRGDQVLYLNQFATESDGSFSLAIPASFAAGETLTVQLGGASSGSSLTADVTAGSNSGTGAAGGSGAAGGTGASGGSGSGSDAGAGSADAWVNPFRDVAANAWYFDAVKFASQKGLFKGTDAARFSPAAPMSRAMLVTVLHRLAGSPAGGTSSFTDVPAGSWYAQPVAWAYGQGVVGGVGGGKFSPNGNVTREQIAAILFRYAKKTGASTSSSGDLGRFTDGGRVGSYALDAVKWAVGCGLLSGKGGGTLDPGGNASRAEVATMFMRFAELTAK